MPKHRDDVAGYFRGVTRGLTASDPYSLAAKDSMADPDFPDIYADSVNVSVGAFGIAITLFLSDPLEDQPFHRTVGRVRMSVDLAKAMNSLLAESLAKVPAPAINDDAAAKEAPE